MTPSSDQISLLDIHEEVEPSPSGVQCSLADTDIQAMYPGHYDFNAFFIKTADPGREDWGGTTYTLNAVGLAYNPGTSDWTQVVVGVDYYGDFTTTTRVDAVETVTRYEWSPLGVNNTETNGDYQIMWTLISGDAVSMGPGFGADGVYVNLGTTGFYFSQTDTVSNGVARTSTVDVTLRSRGSNQTGLDTTQRFILNPDYDSGEGVLWTTTTQSVTSIGVGTRKLCGMRWTTDGTTDKTLIGGTWGSENAPDWADPTPIGGTGSDYQIKYASLTGSTPDELIGTSGTWYLLSAIKYMQYFAGGTGSRSCSFTITIRELNDAATEVACTVNLTQTWEP